MRSRLLVLFLTIGIASSPVLYAQKTKSHSSKKSTVSGSNDGHYQGGKGSSHKGGTYKNDKTGNHERDRKAGTPK